MTRHLMGWYHFSKDSNLFFSVNRRIGKSFIVRSPMHVRAHPISLNVRPGSMNPNPPKPQHILVGKDKGLRK